MKEFKIGQRVQFDPFYDLTVVLPGSTAVVTKLTYMPEYLSIKWIRNSLSKAQIDGEYHSHDFNTKFKPLSTILKKALKWERINNLEYLEFLSKK